MSVCVSVCMFEINSLTPQPIQTKFGVATIQNPAENIGYIRIHTSLKMNNNDTVRHCYVFLLTQQYKQIRYYGSEALE
jgi:hypothetical protein